MFISHGAGGEEVQDRGTDVVRLLARALVLAASARGLSLVHAPRVRHPPGLPL